MALRNLIFINGYKLNDELNIKLRKGIQRVGTQRNEIKSFEKALTLAKFITDYFTIFIHVNTASTFGYSAVLQTWIIIQEIICSESCSETAIKEKVHQIPPLYHSPFYDFTFLF